MPVETLRADVIAEIKKDRETRQRQAFEDRIEASVNSFSRRLMSLETASRNPAPAPPPGEWFYRELMGIIRSYVDTKFGRLKNENEAIINRLKYLEEQPSLKYSGVWESGRNYKRNELVTFEGSLWIAKSATGSCPGAVHDQGRTWQLCVKKGKDAKSWRDEKGWPTS